MCVWCLGVCVFCFFFVLFVCLFVCLFLELKYFLESWWLVERTIRGAQRNVLGDRIESQVKETVQVGLLFIYLFKNG